MNGPALNLLPSLPDGRPDPGGPEVNATDTAVGRALPCDTRAEQSLIGCVLSDNAALAAAAVAGVVAGHFYVDGHDRIWSAIVELDDAGRPIDAGTVFDVLDAAGNAKKCGGLDYLMRLAGCVVSSRGAAGYADAVRQTAAQRHLVQGLEASAEIARQPDGAAKAAEVADETIKRVRAATSPPASRFQLLPAAQFGTLPPMAWRIHSVLPTTGTAGWFGASTVGKSFVALDMVAAVDEGRTWFGHRTKPCRAVYVVLEGEAGFRRRVAAWEQHHQRPFPPGVLFLFGGFQLTSRDDVLALAAAIDAASGAGLIVLDTLNRAAPGEDENTSDGMGRILAGTKELQATTGGLVVLVHHPGKDSAKGMRGHSSLFAALDAAIEVTRTDSRREWKVAKSKDGEDGKVHAFSLRVVDLGEDEDGEAVTSCVVETEQQLDDVAPRAPLPKGGNQKIVYDALGPLFRESGSFGRAGAPATRPCITLDEAIAGARDHLAVPSDRRTERTRQAITGLIATGVLGSNQDWLWLK